MSKMSQLHADLTEQAASLGFGSIEEAEANGYTVNYQEGKLVKYDCCAVAKEQEQAHIAWETQRQSLITKLTLLEDDLEKLDNISKEKLDILEATIGFLRGCKDGA